MSVPTEILDELYGLAPHEFVAARDARAKDLRSSGDKATAAAVKKLPRPSAAAWAVNGLVRRDPVRVHEVLELGEDLRRAQAALDGARLRELSRRRHAVVAAAVGAAVDLARDAGRPLGDAVSRQVEETLQAAVLDPDAAARVTEGRLAESLVPAGFGLAVASDQDEPPTAAAPADVDADEDADTEAVRAVVESARRRAAQARVAADRARHDLADVDRHLDAALDAHREAEERVRRLRKDLREAEQDVSATERAAESAARAKDEAARVADRAARASDAARRRLQALGLDPDA